MAKIDPLDDVGSLANTTSARAVINSNSQKIEDAFANTVSRDGSGPNQMEADFDLNDHYLLNVADPVNEADGVNLRSVRPLVEQFASEIVETAVFGTQVVDPFVASAAQTDFPLSQPPGSIENVSVFVDGVALQPNTEFTLSGAGLQVLTVTSPMAGGESVVIRYTKALPSGIELSQNVTYTPPSTGVGGTVRSFLDSLWNTGTNAGAKLVRWIQTGLGASERTVESRLRDTVSVLDFIPEAEHAAIKAGTTTYDATATIQAAINSLTNGGRLYFPPGVYRLTSELTISANGITLVGANRQTTTLRQDTLNARCVNITGQYCGMSSLGFSYGTGTPVAGATSVRAAGFYGHYRDLVFKRSHVGIEFTGNGGQKLRDFECLEYESVGILITAVNDVFVAGGIINAGSTTRGLLGGVRLAEKAEAIILKDIDVLSGKYSITTFATSYSAGSRPAYNKFVACYFDSASDGSLFSQMVESDFIGCWWSGGRSGAGFAGLTLTQTDSLKFSNCTWFNNGAQGCLVAATALRTTFVACSFESNSVTAGAGASHGLQFANSTTNFQVIGCKARNGLGAGSQGYGVFIGSSCDNFSIVDCDVASNATGGINDGSASTAIKRIAGNIGYRTQIAFSSTVLVGATTRVGNHQLPFTPLAEDFTLQVTGDANASGVTRWWISNITSTQFTINVNTAVTGVALPISIQIRSKGA